MSLNTTHEDEQKDSANEGLPDIANDIERRSKLFIFLTIAIIILGIIWLCTHSNPSTSENKPSAEETFAVNPAAPAIHGTPITQSTPKENLKNDSADSKANEAELSAEAQKELMLRLQAPIMVVSEQSSSANSQNPIENNKSSNDPHSQFLNESGQDVALSEASVLQQRSTLIAQGHLIHAVLETAVNSDLPGYLRATVSEPVYAEDGSQILIPAGSRLIGQYKSGIAIGQNRVFIVWNRVITPQGISVQLGSPGIDSLGIAGQGADKIDRHFWQMFGSASLLSLLGAGSSQIGNSSSDQLNASEAYKQALSQSFAQVSNNSLQQNTAIPPTLHIHQGTHIMVFVAKDLRFDNALKQVGTQINIFQ